MNAARVDERIDAGESTVVFSVLGASPWISGLTPDQQQSLRDLAEQKFAPTEYARRAALADVKKTLTDASFRFANEFVRLRPKVAQQSEKGRAEIDALKGRRTAA